MTSAPVPRAEEIPARSLSPRRVRLTEESLVTTDEQL